MADLTHKEAAQTTKLVGAASATGIESNYADVTSDGRLYVEATVAQGAFAYNFYSVAVEVNMATSGVDNALVLIKNPAGSGKRVVVYSVKIGINVTNTGGLFKIKGNTTVTSNGTAETPTFRSVGGTDPGTVVLAYTLPTVTAATGTTLDIQAVGQNSSPPKIVEDFSIVLEPNNSLLITGYGSSNNRSATATIIWREASI